MEKAADMNIEIVNKQVDMELYGCSGVAINGDFAAAGRSLMDKMWQTVKANGLQGRGVNYWVYDGGQNIFCGIGLLSPPPAGVGLEHRKIHIEKYAYYKHIGPYHLLKTVYAELSGAVKSKGLAETSPYIEKYGHWVEDESKLETEIFMGLK